MCICICFYLPESFSPASIPIVLHPWLACITVYFFSVGSQKHSSEITLWFHGWFSKAHCGYLEEALYIRAPSDRHREACGAPLFFYHFLKWPPPEMRVTSFFWNTLCKKNIQFYHTNPPENSWNLPKLVCQGQYITQYVAFHSFRANLWICHLVKYVFIVYICFLIGLN